MLARNFSISELAALAELARSKNVRTYVAVNTLLKPDEADKAGRLVMRRNCSRRLGTALMLGNDCKSRPVSRI